MSRNRADYDAYYQNWLKDLQDRARVAVKEALSNTYAEFFQMLDVKIRDMFNSVIQDFYSDYTPSFYDRSESLYNLLQTSVGEDYISIRFEPEQMTPFRSGYDGEDGLYDQVFRHGWHGGADRGGTGKKSHPDPGAPYWRRPVDRYTFWGRPASIASISPLEDMKHRVDEYQRVEMKLDFNKIWNYHKANIKI